VLATWASVAASGITVIATITLAWVGWAAYQLSKRLVEATQSQATANQRLAEETARIIEQNRELLAATVREAEAVEAQARAALDLLVETRRDRELAYRPHLVFGRTSGPVPFPRDRLTLYTVTNIGSGPAVNCRMAHHEFSGQPPTRTAWGSTLFDLGAGSSERIAIDEGHWHDNVLDGLLGDGSATIDACCCEDQFGNKFRFAAGFKMPRPRQEEWHPGEPEVRWSGWYMPLLH